MNTTNTTKPAAEVSRGRARGRQVAIAAVMAAAAFTACSGAPVKPPAPAPLTSPSEVRPPKLWPAAVQDVLAEGEYEELESALYAEGSSAAMYAAGVYRLEDSKERKAIVVHSRSPVDEMSEAAAEAAVDEDALDACEEKYGGCGDETCPESAYRACIQAAYRDPYLYLADEGFNCVVLEVSRYALAANGPPNLEDRRTIESVACELEFLTEDLRPVDLDADRGMEVAFVYSTSTPNWDIDITHESLRIVDASDLHDQLRTSTDLNVDEASTLKAVTFEDVDGDGRKDITMHVVKTSDDCSLWDGAWMVPAPIIAPVDPDMQCAVEIESIEHTYRTETDTWTPRQAKP